MEISFTVLGNPKSQARHRDFKRGNFRGHYDPSKQDKDNFLVLAHQHRPPQPLDCPVSLYLQFYFARPQKHYGANGNLKDKAPYWHTSTPDSDNLEKFVLDSLKGVFWRDDSLVCDIHVSKVYSENPRTEIFIKTF